MSVSQLNVIDVICPVYNHASYVEQCLKSILQQENVFVIVHVLDDASTDNTLEIVKKIQQSNPQQIKIYSNELNQGNAAKSMFKQKIMLDGQYWTYIEGDDFLINKKKFITQINLLNQDQNLIATATQCLVWNVKSDTSHIIRPDLARWNYFDLISKEKTHKMYCHISSIVWKNENRKNQQNPVPNAFFEKYKSESEVLLVHLLLKNSRKYLAFQDIEGSCYRVTGKGIWSSLDEVTQQQLNSLLQLEIESIIPFLMKIRRTISSMLAKIRNGR